MSKQIIKNRQLIQLQARLPMRLAFIKDITHKNREVLKHRPGIIAWGGSTEADSLAEWYGLDYSEAYTLAIANGWSTPPLQRRTMRESYAALEQWCTKIGGKSNNTETGGEPAALALLVKYPDWSITKIARTIGCNRRTIYKWPRFQQAYAALRSSKQELPIGTKYEGGIEAWDENR